MGQRHISGIYFVALAFVLIHRVQAFTRLPLKTEYCRFGNSLLMEGLMEWERLMVRE
jgi:hypothetical protein